MFSHDEPNLFGNSYNQFGNSGNGNGNGNGLGSLASLFNGGGINGLGQLLGGLFGNSGGPYKDASKVYNQYLQGAQNFQAPYYFNGLQGVNKYNDWLQGQQDPAAFINKLMGQYSESPYAHNLQQQSMRAGQNAASANGTLGSTPFAQQLQQNAGQIASADQNSWLQNVLGINTQYGQGQNNIMNSGQNSANALTQLLSKVGGDLAGLKYGQSAGQNQDFMSILSGLFGGGGGGGGGGGDFLKMLLPMLMG